MKKKKYKVIKPEDFSPTKLLLARQDEIENEGTIEDTFELTMMILTDLYLLNKGNTKKKRQLRKLTKSITQKQLQQAYWKVANQQTLNYHNKHRQSDKEKLFHQDID